MLCEKEKPKLLKIKKYSAAPPPQKRKKQQCNNLQSSKLQLVGTFERTQLRNLKFKKFRNCKNHGSINYRPKQIVFN